MRIDGETGQTYWDTIHLDEYVYVEMRAEIDCLVAGCPCPGGSRDLSTRIKIYER